MSEKDETLVSQENLEYYDGKIKNYATKKNENVFTANGTNLTVASGDTISDTIVQGLIVKHLPIQLNSHLGYFSYDDGTNYHYFNLMYDSASNVNHLNIITINKTTWVVTFHTSNLSLT